MTSEEDNVIATPGEIDTDIHKPTVESTLAPAAAKADIQNGEYDDAAGLLAKTDDSFHYTKKEERRVLWKLDLILLSMVCGLCARWFVPWN
jgi:hypothetical protein